MVRGWDPGDPRSYLARLALTDLGWSIPTINSHHDPRFWPRLRLQRLRSRKIPPPTCRSTTTKVHGWRRIPRHQSYKANRLSWCAALPLCRATTTCHDLSPAFVKEEERHFFSLRRTDTSRAVSSSEAYGRRAMSFWREESRVRI